MRIVAWNSCQKFTQNLHHLLELRFDIAVVSEAAPVDAAVAERHGLTWSMTRPAVGSSKSLMVLAASPWRIEATIVSASTPWALVTEVAGPVGVTMVGVWPVKDAGYPSYTEQLARVIDTVLPTLSGEVVLAGDLNAPIADTLARHLSNHDALTKQGLVDAFLTARGVSASDAYTPATDLQYPRVLASPALSEPTYYHRRQRSEGFHIDHVYVPAAWADGISVGIGSYDTWVAPGLSDHTPVIVDIASPQKVDGANSVEEERQRIGMVHSVSDLLTSSSGRNFEAPVLVESWQDNGVATWRRGYGSWELSSMPEEYALPPILSWDEGHRRLLLDAYIARWGILLEESQEYQVTWPPRGSLTSAGEVFAGDPLPCPRHGDGVVAGCDICADPPNGPDRATPARWEWYVTIETWEDSGNNSWTVVDSEQLIVMVTEVDPREVEYSDFGAVR